MTLLDDYLARTPHSRELFERATGSLPGGSTRTTVFTPPYPPYVASGEGLVIRDVDGNTYRDFLGNYTSLILGHAHPAVVAAVEAQVRRGSAFAAPTETEIELAEELRRRVPSIERVRFTSSGTEATMFAIRAARAFTGRTLVAKFERSYHGTHDAVMAGTTGVPDAMSGLIVELPWGDADAIERILRGRERELAAIIIEPVQGAGGVRAAGAAFLAFLRSFADRHGALLIFDEIISFRVGPGGAQGLAGVRPDLTTLGKIIGGGYPLAAFGGRADVMAVYDSRRTGSISHGGTFNGNPVAAAAGLATLRELTPAAYARLDALGERLRTAIEATIEHDLGVAAGEPGETAARVEVVGSLFQVWSGAAASAVATGVGDAPGLFVGLLLEGFYLAPRGMGAIPAIATERDVDDLAAAVGRVLVALRRTPELAPA
jgi:glutamate-1-semialdehyde 2,1-aminomutase